MHILFEGMDWVHTVPRHSDRPKSKVGWITRPQARNPPERSHRIGGLHVLIHPTLLKKPTANAARIRVIPVTLSDEYLPKSA